MTDNKKIVGEVRGQRHCCSEALHQTHLISSHIYECSSINHQHEPALRK